MIGHPHHEIALFRDVAEREFALTITLLSGIPGPGLDTVEPDSGHTLRELAWEFVTGERRAHDLVWGARPRPADPAPAALEDLLEEYERVRDAWLAHLDDLPVDAPHGPSRRRAEMLWAHLHGCAARRERLARRLRNALSAAPGAAGPSGPHAPCPVNARRIA